MIPGHILRSDDTVYTPVHDPTVSGPDATFGAVENPTHGLHDWCLFTDNFADTAHTVRLSGHDGCGARHGTP